ncbi:MAG TPA: ATP-grasp domain-containing protein, partial [Candidatus Acidoferrales bacterium]|nr:ATP-grasp domain-containing protein [Candidatus Acidoferrales bacterium]
MKITVYEYVSGGGFAGQPIPPGVLAEGYAMLRGIVADFKAEGHEVVVLLDQRIAKFKLPLAADKIIKISDSNQPEQILTDNATTNEAVYIIAPETDQTLKKLVKAIEATGKICLNCTSSSIAAVSNKARLYEFMQNNDYTTPKTLTLNTEQSEKNINTQITENLTFPIILKPIDGTSGNAISKVKNPTEIEAAIKKIKKYSKTPQFITQEYITGLSASVSVISNGQKAIAISLNKQQITLASPEAESSYIGGCVPLEHLQKQKAFALAERLVEAFSGLQGYVGVDVILGEDKPYIVDVNPRLTTSYVGLHAVSDFNVAEAIVLA